ncbi:FAD-binding oxidoreductase [Streptomyces wuyuanensis]|uniref:FAD binding domain-containing protein n=1 Tax=Streptomyces wuyuanensis TaxID=1196353 RepID=A0A1G9U174_9ACTN|nr:FAD-dependent oxidoreductase [Streptomyces wuyuanensis]SDM53790.1 FAD binding domain-containing protein [Streptomyces wuyuanensis]
MTLLPDAVPSPLTGKVVTPGDNRYPLLRSTYTTVGGPAAVVLPESAADIAEALRLARERGLPVAVRSGGHGLTGRATNNDGLVIDLGAMRRVDVLDRATGLVRVEAGARWAAVARALAPHGLAISSGDHGNVGVGGLATGGGVGWFVRHYGLTVDRIRAVEVVLADGSAVRADPSHEPDLFWAMRGAGAGTGIAVAFEIEAIELGAVGLAQLAVDVDPRGSALRRWAAAMAEAPRELTTAVVLASQGASTSAFVTAVVASDSPRVIRAGLEPLLGLGELLGGQAHVVPYTALVPTNHLHPNTGQMPATTTNGLLTDMTPDAARALVTAASGPGAAMVQLRSVGGAVNDTDPSATAYAHRHQRTLVIATAFPPGGRRALEAAWKGVAPHTDGAYVNFESNPDEAAFRRAYPGATGDRVTALRERYDPDRALRPWAV